MLHSPWSTKDHSEFLAGQPHGRRVDERHTIFDVLDDRMIK